MELMVANQPAGVRATPRARYRAQIREEIKQQALRQLAESGPAGISVNAIGKELGVSGPALYRYFSSRDDLLTELVIDAPSLKAKPPQALASETARWMESRGVDADVATGLAAVQIWWRMHGFLSLEIAGNYASMGLDSDTLFELELAALES